MLTKKDKKKRYNKSVKSKGHSFAGTWTQLTQDAFTESPGSAISGVASAAAGASGTGMDAVKLQGIEEAQAEIDKQKAFQSSATDNDSLLAEMAGATNIKSNYTQKDFLQSGGDFAKGLASGVLQGAASGAAAGPWGAVAGAGAALLSGTIGRLAARSKAKTEVAEKNQAAKEANLAKAQALTAKAGSLDQAADARSLAAYYAEGGAINPFPSSQFGSPVTEFNAGGSHEENPYDGIPQGIAPDGLPNLVEEGEVKFDNYIFSDRLMLTKQDKKKYKFLKGKTYADAAKAIKKELGIDERPNDLLAQTDLEEQLNLLSTLQEEKRAKRGLRGENRMMYAKGGHLFAGPSDDMYPIWEDPHYATMYLEGDILPNKPLFSVSPIPKEVLSTDRPSFKVIDRLDYNRIPKFNKSGEAITDKYGMTQFRRINPEDNDYRPIVLGSQTQIDKDIQKNSVRPLTLDSLDLSKSNRPSFTPNKPKITNTENWGSALAQSMPALGSAIGLISNLADKPTYEHTKRLTQPEEAVTPITYTPTHQDIRLDRFDTNYHANKLAAQAGATRRAIREQTASNPYATTAALLAADANAQSQMGDLYRKAAEYNQGLALQEAKFNSAGRAADAEGFLKAASANATLRDKALSRQAEKDIYAARLNMVEDQAWDTANSANMTSLFDNLGAIGKEDQEFALAALKIFGEGKVTPEMQRMLLPRLQKILAKAGYKYGGKLRKKKGYTI